MTRYRIKRSATGASYRGAKDIILNPLEPRHPSWNIFSGIAAVNEFEQIAHSQIRAPEDQTTATSGTAHLPMPPTQQEVF